MITTPLSPPKIRGEVDQELFEERAAILEYDAGLPIDEAEKKAEEMITSSRKGQRNMSL